MTEDIVSIVGLHVSQTHRRHGYASLLLNSFFKWAGEHGLHKLRGGEFKPEFGDTKTAESFYKKHGIEVDKDNNLFKDF